MESGIRNVLKVLLLIIVAMASVVLIFNAINSLPDEETKTMEISAWLPDKDRVVSDYNEVELLYGGVPLTEIEDKRSLGGRLSVVKYISVETMKQHERSFEEIWAIIDIEGYTQQSNGEIFHGRKIVYLAKNQSENKIFVANEELPVPPFYKVVSAEALLSNSISLTLHRSYGDSVISSKIFFGLLAGCFLAILLARYLFRNVAEYIRKK